MALVEKSVLVGHSAQRMYALVDCVEDYPKFLPWCGGSTVEHRDGSITRASIVIDYHGIRQSFRTENRTTPPELIDIGLLSGPFRELDGLWRFVPLGDEACRVEFRLQYEFSSKLLEKLTGRVFAYIADTFVDAFVRRAEQLYGA